MNLSHAYINELGQTFKHGDRVIYVGTSKAITRLNTGIFEGAVVSDKFRVEKVKVVDAENRTRPVYLPLHRVFKPTTEIDEIFTHI